MAPRGRVRREVSQSMEISLLILVGSGSKSPAKKDTRNHMHKFGAIGPNVSWWTWKFLRPGNLILT